MRGNERKINQIERKGKTREGKERKVEKGRRREGQGIK